MEQSFVGNTLSNRAILPPIEGSFSTRYTLKPISARSSAACIPATPAPTTRALSITGTSLACNGSRSFALSTPMRTRSFAFSVALSFSHMCIHEQWSLIFTNSRKYWFKPISSIHARNVGSWVFGEHAATTIRLRLCSFRTFWMSACPESEQVNLFTEVANTPGIVAM